MTEIYLEDLSIMGVYLKNLLMLLCLINVRNKSVLVKLIFIVALCKFLKSKNLNPKSFWRLKCIPCVNIDKPRTTRNEPKCFNLYGSVLFGLIRVSIWIYLSLRCVVAYSISFCSEKPWYLLCLYVFLSCLSCL